MPQFYQVFSTTLKVLLSLFLICVGLSAIFVLLSIVGERSRHRYEHRQDTFAQCLTDRKVKMYGAYWDPHTDDQMKLFGASFAHVNYIECSIPGQRGLQPECLKAGVKQISFEEGEEDGTGWGTSSFISLS
jgi:hypothetical protein